MRKLLLLLALLPLAAHAQGTAAIQDHCTQGGTQALLSGLSSTNYQMGIVPSCTVTVYLTGTLTKATIYSDVSGTPLSNPFTANTASSLDAGGWIFWATVNQGYDIVLSGGIGPNIYSSPITLTGRYPGFSFNGGGGSVTPCGTAGQIQVANTAGTALDCDPNLFINTTTHTLNSKANALINALSSIPRADFDPMDTQYDGGLAAAIAGTSGFTPTQVINAAIDAGQCSAILNLTPFHSVNIPLPNGVTINISGIKLWGGTSIGGSSATLGPNLQHNDSSQVMIIGHAVGDALVCNGTTYHPASGGVGSVYIHDIGIAGMFAPTTYTDIGVELNMFSSAAVRIRGFGSAFGASGVLSNGTSTFISEIGYPGSQVQGCKTFNTGVLPVAGYTAGNGLCGAVQDDSLDGGASNLYSSDGQAFATNHAAGPCYPGCAAVVANGNGTYDTDIFAQISSIGIIVSGTNVKVNIFRGDFFSREAIRVFAGAPHINNIMIDSACTDKALQANYNAGIPTGCFPVQAGANTNLSNMALFNNAGIFDASYVQALIFDGSTGFTGNSSLYSQITYQGNPNNTTANNWLIAGNDNTQIAARVVFPAMPPMQSTGSSINASGITGAYLTGNTVSSIIAGVPGQRLTITGNGTINPSSSINTYNGLPQIMSCGAADLRTCPQVFEFVATAPNFWAQMPPPVTTIYSAAGTPLPTCAAAAKGSQLVVSDATAPAYMTAYTSGGAITATVICSYNGTIYAWKTN
jgi:hypothetical protein